MKSLLSLIILTVLSSCNAMSEEDKKPAAMPEVPEGAEVITLGAGCFWCVEVVFEQLDGVYSSTSGYMGGTVANPTYEAVCQGTTGHAEVVQVVFDPKKTDLKTILAWFWKAHDPTTLNRQGADVGTQYRSAIYYQDEAQKKVAEASKKAAQSDFDSPIVTEITKASTFYPAEGYHQDFYLQNKKKNGYCRLVIEPKLKKLKLDH
ncbi:peptide-methionine (S)-S-oxide reductase MsrA [Haloferula rosea]|uniref:Peptide methionine sulfoxide reductase MsrA n=1 Tax=Haloferula rosea TaxID=490093 RepID=A0A934R8N6_9BACT|nr:peptide-methionine (S)-S-oxide reductase MsrA [Haloferula rosea]MBK1825998.1 peptide-methionine (S)-S-oxide reductase MsrA [Haloferula rosea]